MVVIVIDGSKKRNRKLALELRVCVLLKGAVPNPCQHRGRTKPFNQTNEI